MSYQGLTFALMIGVAIGTAIYYYFKSDNTPYTYQNTNQDNVYDYYLPQPSEACDTLPNKRRRRNSNSTSSCSICLESLRGKRPTKQINCDHVFHAHCIDTWFRTSNTCPICRKSNLPL